MRNTNERIRKHKQHDDWQLTCSYQVHGTAARDSLTDHQQRETRARSGSSSPRSMLLLLLLMLLLLVPGKWQWW
jgi:Flp pilus assembly protein TadB